MGKEIESTPSKVTAQMLSNGDGRICYMVCDLTYQHRIFLSFCFFVCLFLIEVQLIYNASGVWQSDLKYALFSDYFPL